MKHNVLYSDVVVLHEALLNFTPTLVIAKNSATTHTIKQFPMSETITRYN